VATRVEILTDNPMPVTACGRDDEQHARAIRDACEALTALCRDAAAAGLDVGIMSGGEGEAIEVTPYVSRHFLPEA